MKSFEKPEQKTGVEKIREIIGSARENIERELSSGAGNNWIACYKTVLTALNGWLYLAKSHNEIGREEYSRAYEKIMELAKVASDLHNQYPEVGDIPSDELKEKLISRLDEIVPPGRT